MDETSYRLVGFLGMARLHRNGLDDAWQGLSRETDDRHLSRGPFFDDLKTFLKALAMDIPRETFSLGCVVVW